MLIIADVCPVVCAVLQGWTHMYDMYEWHGLFSTIFSCVYQFSKEAVESQIQVSFIIVHQQSIEKPNKGLEKMNEMIGLFLL